MAFQKGIVSRGWERVNVTMPIATTAISQYVFIADKPYELIGAQLIYDVVAGQACTLDVTKNTGTTAVASGTTMLASTFDCTATARTLVSKTLSNGGLTTTAANRFLAAGDKIALKIGTSTSMVGANVRLTLRPVGAKASIF